MKRHFGFFPQFLSIFVILVLAVLPCVQGFRPPARVAAASQEETNSHRTLSNAKALSVDASCRQTIAAHDTVCYCCSVKENLTFTVKSDALGSLRTELLSASGASLDKNAVTKNNVCTVSPSASACQNNNRLFLRLTNNASEAVTVTVSAAVAKQSDSSEKNTTKNEQKSSAKNQSTSADTLNDKTTNSADSETKNSSSSSKNSASSSEKSSDSVSSLSLTTEDKTAQKSSPENNNTASSSAKKSKKTKHQAGEKTANESAETACTQGLALSPQVCFLEQGKSLSLSVCRQSGENDIREFTLKSSDTKVVTVTQDGTMIARKPGFAVITATAAFPLEDQFRQPQKSSCLVRVI